MKIDIQVPGLTVYHLVGLEQFYFLPSVSVSEIGVAHSLPL